MTLRSKTRGNNREKDATRRPSQGPVMHASNAAAVDSVETRIDMH